MRELNSVLLIALCIALAVFCIAIVWRAHQLSRRDKWRVIPRNTSVVRTPSTLMVVHRPVAEVKHEPLPALLREQAW